MTLRRVRREARSTPISQATKGLRERLAAGPVAGPRRPHGMSVALLGPDGAGKSTLAAGIQQSFQVPVRVLYMGLGSDHQSGPAWTRRLGRAGRLLTLWGRYLNARYYQAHGRLVIFDRYTYDALLTPSEGLTWIGRLSRWIRAHACPAPDLAVLLDVPGDVMYQRKGEHSPAHLEAERQRFLALRERIPQMVVVDATRAAETVHADVIDQIRCWFAMRNGEADILPGDHARGMAASAEGLVIPQIRNATNRLSLRLLPPAGSVWRRWGHRRDLARTGALVPAILSMVEEESGMPLAAARVHRTAWTPSGVVVISIAQPSQPPTVVLKLPQSPNGVASLERQAAALTALLTDSRLGDWGALLPQPLATGDIDGQFFLAERALPGREARFLLHDPAACLRVHDAAIAGISQFHRRTASTVTVDGDLLERWVDRPLAIIRRSSVLLPMAGHVNRHLQEIEQELHSELLGRSVRIGWIHGDFWVSNLLVTAGGSRLTGIVDWERSAPDELPTHDLVQLLIQTRRLMARQPEISEALRELLSGGDWTPRERRLIEAANLSDISDPDDRRVMLLLYWLRYLANYLTQYPERAHDQRWVAKNIADVLRCI